MSCPTCGEVCVLSDDRSAAGVLSKKIEEERAEHKKELERMAAYYQGEESALRERLQLEHERTKARLERLRDACTVILDSLDDYVRRSMYSNPEWISVIKAMRAALAETAPPKEKP